VPAPTTNIQVTSSTGTKAIEVLPDSGADISAAGQETLRILSHHVDNLLPSSVSPKVVDGTTMIPWGKIPPTLQLGQWTCEEDIHIYAGISGAIILWKAAKALHSLPHHYPYPAGWEPYSGAENIVKAIILTHDNNATELLKEYPTVFNGQVTTMEGECLPHH